MGEVLIKAGSFACIIALAQLLKRVGFLKIEDYPVLTKIMMNLTLPASVLCSFADAEMSPILLLIALFGFLTNVIMVAVGAFTGRKKDPHVRALRVINYGGYNIGCFAMPFMQNFLGHNAVIATGMFDIGNALLVLGGSHAVASRFVNAEATSFKDTLKRLFSSVPLLVYLSLFVLSIIGFEIPKPILSVAGIIGNANAFFAMMAIGLVMDFHIDRNALRELFTAMFWRYLFAALFALGFYFLLPIALEYRQVLCLLCFAPISSTAPVWMRKLNGDAGLAGTLNSCAILVSIVVMTALVIAFGIM